MNEYIQNALVPQPILNYMHKYIFYVYYFRFHFKNYCLILFYIKANGISMNRYKVCQGFKIKVTSGKLYVDVKIKMFSPLLFFFI